MMRWTQASYDRLLRAYRSGARKVKYEDKEIEYRSQAEMERALREAEAELEEKSNLLSSRRTLGTFSKGIGK